MLLVLQPGQARLNAARGAVSALSEPVPLPALLDEAAVWCNCPSLLLHTCRLGWAGQSRCGAEQRGLVQASIAASATRTLASERSGGGCWGHPAVVGAALGGICVIWRVAARLACIKDAHVPWYAGPGLPVRRRWRSVRSQALVFARPPARCERPSQVAPSNLSAHHLHWRHDARRV